MSSSPVQPSLKQFTLLITGLKWTLTVRHYQPHTASAAAGLAGLGVALLLLLVTLAGIGISLRFGGWVQRDAYLLWTLWAATLVWTLSPLGQLDLQRNLDLSGLRLFPISRSRFALAVVLDAACSPLGLLSAVGGVISWVSFALGPAEVVALGLALLLLAGFQLGCAQMVYLALNRVLASRRFSDLSLVLGLLSLLGLQGANFLLQSAGQLPAWLDEALATAGQVIRPIGQWLAPGVAVQSVSAAGQGWLLHAAGLFTLLAAQALLALAGAGWLAQRFYEGQLESGGSVAPKRQGGARLKLARARASGVLHSMLWRERAYLWRDPLVKMQLLQSLFGSVYLAVVIVLLAFRRGDAYFDARLAEWGKYLVLGLALMLGFAESAVLFNRFGYEGGQIANLLVTPVSRRRLLASKSLHLVAHFLPLNVALVLTAAAALKAPPLFWALAALLVITNTLLLDVIGQYVSIYLPFAYRRVGRRVRAVMPQPGCGYVFVYVLVFQLCHLLTMPLSALSIALSLMGGWPGLGLAAAVCAGAGWLAYAISLPDAAYRLQQREPQLLATLATGAE